MRLHLLSVRMRVFSLFFDNEQKFNLFGIPFNECGREVFNRISKAKSLNKLELMCVISSESVHSTLCESRKI